MTSLKRNLQNSHCCTIQHVCNGEHKNSLWNKNKLLAIGNVIHCVGRNVVVKYYDKENNNELDSNTELMKKLMTYR